MPINSSVLLTLSIWLCLLLFVPSLLFCQQGLALTMNNHGQGPQQRARSVSEFLGLVFGAVKMHSLWLCQGKTHTHYKRLFAYTCIHSSPPSHPSSKKSCSLPGSGGSTLTEAVHSIMFASICIRGCCGCVFCGLCDAQGESRNAFVYRGQLRCENSSQNFTIRAAWGKRMWSNECWF